MCSTNFFYRFYKKKINILMIFLIFLYVLFMSYISKKSSSFFYNLNDFINIKFLLLLLYIHLLHLFFGSHIRNSLQHISKIEQFCLILIYIFYYWYIWLHFFPDCIYSYLQKKYVSSFRRSVNVYLKGPVLMLWPSRALSSLSFQTSHSSGDPSSK